MEPWLGICHLRKADSTGESYTVIAAVLCHDHKTYDHALKAVLEPQGYHLIWSEEVHPAGQWVARHPAERSAAALARAVHERHIVKIGTLKDGGAKGEDAPDQESYLIIEEIDGVEPLDAQRGVWPGKNIPDMLVEPLFGHVDPTEEETSHYGSAGAVPPMKTYAILDAAKFQWGFSEIELCEMPFRCLFKGDAAKELKDIAPYLVELDPEASFTRRLFKYVPEMPDIMTSVHLWHKEPGIYIRSRSDFDALWKHFRKFARLYSENDQKWHYFRFYAPETARTIVAAFDEKQFEKFGKDIALIACQSQNGFCILTRRPKSIATNSQKIA